MTFFEAAVEILRQQGRALHYKKITELAIEQKLLSHVGRTPHVTMEARLTQEAEKDTEASVRRIRPGVFVLSDGIAADTVRETERVDQAEDDGESAISTASRGGRRRGRGKASPDAPPGPDNGTTPKRRRRRRRGSLIADEPNPAEEALPTPTPAATRPDRPLYPTLAEAVEQALSESPSPMTARALAARLSLTPEDPVSPLVLEQAIRGHNRKHASRGLRPTFVRVDEGWVLCNNGLDAALAGLHDGVERRHRDVVDATSEALARALERLRGRELEAFVRATLEGLGYTVLPLERDAKAATFQAGRSDLLIPLQAAVTVWHGQQPVTRNDVAALRGRLHRYGATHGVIVSVRRGGVDSSALSEANAGPEDQPVVLFDAAKLAPLAQRVGVGVVGYRLDVPLMDATWFGPEIDEA